jgi:hypothetical protein
VQKPVQQSDHVEIWDKGEEVVKVERRRGAFERSVRDALNGVRAQRKVGRKDLTRTRSDIIRRPVRELAPTF